MGDRPVALRVARTAAGARAGRLSRRAFLAGLVAAGATACRGGGGSSGGGAGAGTAPTLRVEPALAVFDRPHRVDPVNLRVFADRFQVRLHQQTFHSDEEMYEAVRRGAERFDVIVPSSTYVRLMGDEGLLYELQHELLPNLQNVADEFLDRPYDPGNRWSVPKDYGVTGFGYRTDVVRERPRSWADFYRILPRYAGRGVNWVEGANQNVATAIASFGGDVNSDDEEVLARATRVLLRARSHVDTISSSYVRRFIRGHLVLSMASNGDFARVVAARPLDTEFVFPEGVADYWVDNWAIAATTAHPAAAHAFIDFELSARAMARDWEHAGLAIPSARARQLIPQSMRRNPLAAPVADVVADYQTIAPTAEGVQMRAEIWARVLAA